MLHRSLAGGYSCDVPRTADLVAMTAPVPQRTAICLSCRTALFAGEACDVDPAHAVASLEKSRGRELLVEAAWGPPDVRLGEARLALHAEHAVALLALFGFVAGLLALWLILPGLGPLHVLGAALSMARDLNVLAQRGGDAAALGVDVRRVAFALYALASLATAAAVTTAGNIGFVGLIVPHATRVALGNDHRLLLPAAAAIGGTLLVVADTLARTIVAPLELPVGVLTALIGVPAFLWLLNRSR